MKNKPDGLFFNRQFCAEAQNCCDRRGEITCVISPRGLSVKRFGMEVKMEQLLRFEKNYAPMFRDSDADGFIGVRAYLYYFQDMSTEHLYHMGKGNDTLPENYGAAWIYTKYKMRVFKRVDYSRPLHLETWIEKQDKMRIWQDLKISAGQEVCALGRLESFVFHLKEQKIGRLSDIEMPEAAASGEKIDLAPFSRIKPDLSEMEYVFSHTVQYSDLDKSRHMANLRYVNLMENVFSPEFYAQNSLKEIELHFLAQSFYHDEIRMYRKTDGNSWLAAGIKPDGTAVLSGRMKF